MVLFDVGLQVGQQLHPGAAPLHVRLVLLFPLLQHAVGVELAGVVHLLDIGRGRGRHGHPTQRRDALGNSRQVVEERGGAVLLAELLDGRDLLAGGREELHLFGLRRLAPCCSQLNVAELCPRIQNQ